MTGNPKFTLKQLITFCTPTFQKLRKVPELFQNYEKCPNFSKITKSARTFPKLRKVPELFPKLQNMPLKFLSNLQK